MGKASRLRRETQRAANVLHATLGNQGFDFMLIVSESGSESGMCVSNCTDLEMVKRRITNVTTNHGKSEIGSVSDASARAGVPCA